MPISKRWWKLGKINTFLLSNQSSNATREPWVISDWRSSNSDRNG
jgi:hypothetical protein